MKLKNSLKEKRQELSAKQAEIRTAIADGKATEEIRTELDKAKALQEEIRTLEEVIEMEEATSEVPEEIKQENRNVKVTGEKAIRSYLKAKGNYDKLTDEERSMLIEGTAGAGQTSFGVIVPVDVSTKIEEHKRTRVSLKDYCDVQRTGTTSGTYVYESEEKMTGLADLSEGQDIEETEGSLENGTYKINDKAALIPISNNLINDEQGDLSGYIGRLFSKKANYTENKAILDKIKEMVGVNKTNLVKAKDIRTLFNKKVCSALLSESIVLTNQSGFDILDNGVDERGKSLLNNSLPGETEKRLRNRPLVVLDDTLLANIAGKSPLYVVNLFEAVKFMERQGVELAFSSEAGFKKNVSYTRVIERFGLGKKDDKAVVYAELDPTGFEAEALKVSVAGNVNTVNVTPATPPVI
ncbi:MAG: phage major capsid protein [Clostridia bacterium]